MVVPVRRQVPETDLAERALLWWVLSFIFILLHAGRRPMAAAVLLLQKDLLPPQTDTTGHSRALCLRRMMCTSRFVVSCVFGATTTAALLQIYLSVRRGQPCRAFYRRSNCRRPTVEEPPPGYFATLVRPGTTLPLQSWFELPVARWHVVLCPLITRDWWNSFLLVYS